jgi:type I restriction enzyme S subunit
MTDLPGSWVRTTLGELGVEVQPGFASGVHNQSGNGVIHLRPMNITRDGKISIDDARFVDDQTDRRVQYGDVLFNNTNSPALTGKTALVTLQEPAAFSNHMTRLRPPTDIDGKFFAAQLHWLWATGYFRSVLNNHVNQASVSSASLLETPLVIPPVAEQGRIVESLEDHLSGLDHFVLQIQTAVRLMAKLDQTVITRAVSGTLVDHGGADIRGEAGHLVEPMEQGRRRRPPKPTSYRHPVAFPDHWRQPLLGDIATRIEYGTSAKASADHNPDDDVAVLRMGNIRDGQISADNLKYLPSNHPDVRKLTLDDGDLLFNRTNSAELVGKSAVYRAKLGRMTFASYLIRCKFGSDVDPDWINLVINSTFGRRYISAVATQQVGQANVNGSKLASMPMPLPSRSEQEAILAAVTEVRDKTHRLRRQAERMLQRAGLLRQALLRAAFEGVLVDQDPVDEPASKLLERIRRERAHSPKQRARRTRANASQETLL